LFVIFWAYAFASLSHYEVCFACFFKRGKDIEYKNVYKNSNGLFTNPDGSGYRVARTAGITITDKAQTMGS